MGWRCWRKVEEVSMCLAVRPLGRRVLPWVTLGSGAYPGPKTEITYERGDHRGA